MDTPKRVLIVEDDAHIAELLRMHLRDEGYAIEHAADGHPGLRELERGNWDALVLDLMLPGIDGLEICRRARAMTRYTPIIIISARSSEVHRILGLELGADDYLAKTLLGAGAGGAGEGAAAAYRRDGAQRAHGLGQPHAGQPRHRAAVARGSGGRQAGRTHAARVRPAVLLRAQPRQGVLSARSAQPGLGYQHDGYEHTVNTHINRLRTKVEADPAQPKRILTVWGRGYKLSGTGSAEEAA
ncbi:response regulator receiver domain-containing protein [Ditylenchus destructor]|uniref:Probable transcriptional regulator ycf27 n=1 Tax=Ditylenchus destructor TaxID=166010 RepID=A0AAD4MG46_9BILA|nr:response regulator receiver domain-containing protein [Ditylenchus destructor]